MDTQNNVLSKKKITFGSIFLAYLYNSISAALIVFVPFMLASFIITMTKLSGSTNNIDAIKEQILTNPLAFWLSVLIGLVSIILAILSLIYDLGKNYQIDKNNYKKALNFTLVLLIARFIIAPSDTNLILIIIGIALLYIVGGKKFGDNKKILENKVLSLKNSSLVMIGIFIITLIVMYFV